MRSCGSRTQRLQKHGRYSIGSKGQFSRTNQTTNYQYTPEAEVVFVVQALADTDSDGYTDEVETELGTDPTNSSEIPVSLFNVFNNV